MNVLNQFFTGVQIAAALTAIAVLLFIIAFKDDFKKKVRSVK